MKPRRHVPLVVHLDGFFDNPNGDFSEELSILEPHGIRFAADPSRSCEAEVVMFRAVGIDAARISSFMRCRTLIRYGIGLDKVDIRAATRAGMSVCNVPDFCIGEMADHTLTLVMMLSRRIADYQRVACNGVWSLTREFPITASTDRLFATVGFGRIAREVLNRAKAFGFALAAYDPFVSSTEMERLGVRSLPLDKLMTSADVLSLHCPLNEKTKHLIDEKSLSFMKSTALIINTARGGLIDLDALTAALANSRLGGAGLDVTEPEPLPARHKIYEIPNAIITPHMAWYSEQAEKRLKKHAAEEALRAISGEPLRYQVNRAGRL